VKRSLFAIILLLVFGGIRVSVAAAHEFSGFVEAEGRYFFHDPLFPEQERNSASIAAQPEYYHEYENGSSFTATLFARIDSADSERSHFDVREFIYLWLGDSWELRFGIGKVFWGVTEFVHLVDIINQTDLVEDIDGEDKLGQPMVNLSLIRGWGTVDLFVLPYFRERTFPGPKGRLRTEPPVDTDNPEYESSAEQQHVDFAIRYSHSLGNWDFGIYNFNGTGREPTLLPDLDESGEPVLIPFYEQINQTGLDMQLVTGNWLLKLEALYRTGQGDDFFSSIGGFEYTFVNFAQSGMDLSLIGEWAYDERGEEATTSFQNDAIVGLRLAVNDAAGTELLVGFSQDLKSSGHFLNVEGSRRFGDNWLLSLVSRFFFDIPEDDPYFNIRDDDYIQLVLSYYF
jgi:hypothetical protein